MHNIFIRTNIAPYRIDTYNALYQQLNMMMCFYSKEGKAQQFNVEKMEALCLFKPRILKGITFGGMNRKWCFGLWYMLFKEKPEVVIVPEFQISAIQVLLYRWLMHRHFKVVSMVDDSYDMIVNNNDFTKLHAWLRKHVTRYFDNVIVVTPEVEHWYQAHFGKGIWLPIIMDDDKATAYFQSLLPRSRKLAVSYGLKGKKILLSVGRLVDLKNLHRVLDAFAQVKTEATLVIVGEGPDREALERHASIIKKEIIFTGRFDGDELYAWYNLATAFILASYLEPFGAVTNEALLAGCRVIISEKAGSSCLVNEENGELIDPMDVSLITDAIDRQLGVASVPDFLHPRKSLMTITFDERINNLVNELKK